MRSLCLLISFVFVFTLVLRGGESWELPNSIENIIEDDDLIEWKDNIQLKDIEWERLEAKKLRDEGERIRVKRGLWVEQLRREWEAREKQRQDEEAAEARRRADEEMREWKEAREREEEETRLRDEDVERRKWEEGWQREDTRRQAVPEDSSYEDVPILSSASMMTGTRQAPIASFTSGQYENQGELRSNNNPYSQQYNEGDFFGNKDYFPKQSSQSYYGNKGIEGFSSNPEVFTYQPQIKNPHLARVQVGQGSLNVRSGTKESWLSQLEREEGALKSQQEEEERLEEERRRKEAEREAEEENDEREALEIERRYQAIFQRDIGF